MMPSTPGQQPFAQHFHEKRRRLPLTTCKLKTGNMVEHGGFFLLPFSGVGWC